MASKVVANWKGGADLQERISSFDARMKKVVAGQVMYAAPEATTYMKENAPWTDRTGNARAGLNATTNITEDFAELVLAHSVPYGIWLEVRFSGKFAIIMPAVLHIGALIMQRLAHSIDRLEAMEMNQ